MSEPDSAKPGDEAPTDPALEGSAKVAPSAAAPIAPPVRRGRLSRALAALDIQPRPLRAFLWALITMDLRAFQYGKAAQLGANATLSPLFWVIGQFLAASLLLSAFLFARVDVYFFSFAGLSAAMALVISAVVVEFHEAVLDPADRLVVGPRPLTPRTYAAARMGNFLFYVSLLGAAVTIFPAVIGAFLRDAGPGYLPAYAVASFFACLAAASLVVLVLTTAGADAPLETLQTVLTWSQVVLLVGVFYGGQLVLRKGSSGLAVFAARPPEWFHFLPPHWLAKGVESAALHGFSTSLLAGALVAAALSFGLLLAALVQLSRAYSNLQGSQGAWRRARLPRPAKAGTVSGGAFTRWLTRGRAEAAGFWLTATHVARDPELKSRSIPALGTAFAGVALAVATGNCADPFLGLDRAALLPIAVVVLLASALPAMAQNVSFSRDSDAVWVLESAPCPEPDQVVRGVRKALLWIWFYPALALLWIVLAIVWRAPLHALAHVGFAWLVVEISAAWSTAAVLGGYPFRQPLVRGGSLGPIAVPTLVVSCAASSLGVVYAFALSHPGLLVAFFVGLLALRWGVDRQAGAQLRARLGAARG